MSEQQQSPSRQEKRKALTRAKLLRAAHRLSSERGFTEVGIAEIAAAADVATGTFYNYFSSREEILGVAAAESMEFVGDALDRTVSGLSDPAVVWSMSLRHLMRYALGETIWGWFFVRMGAAHPALLATFGPRARRDLQRGIDAGRFRIDDLDLAVTCTFGALIAAVERGLSHPEITNHDERFAKAMLCMVGISPVDARQIAVLPLSELQPDPRNGLGPFAP